MIRFRPATQADLPAIIGLLAADQLGATREVVSDSVDPAYRAAFDAIEEDPNQLLVVADAEGAVAGTMQLSFIPGLSRTGAWRMQIEGVRVAAAHRGDGLGTDMIHWAVEQAEQRGCALVQLTTDATRQEAHRFYERLGFVASHVGMKRRLDT